MQFSKSQGPFEADTVLKEPERGSMEGGPNEDLFPVAYTSADATNGDAPQYANDRDIVRLIRYVVEGEVRARKPHEGDWIRVWDQYNGRFAAFDNKADWQSQKALPKVAMAAERITAMLCRLIMLNPDWFAMEHPSIDEEVILNHLTYMMKQYLNDEDVKFNTFLSDLFKTGLISELLPYIMTWEVPPGSDEPSPSSGSGSGFSLFGGAGHSGLLSFSQPQGGREPVSPEPMPNRKRSLPRLESFMPYCVLKDSGRHPDKQRWIVRLIHYNRGEFRADAKRFGFRNVEDTLASASSATGMTEFPRLTFLEDLARDQIPMSSNSEQNDSVWLIEFWGTLYNELGETVLDNQHVIVANGTHVVYGPEDNPFEHGNWPVQAPSLMRVPNSPYGKSLLTLSADLTESVVEFANMCIDYFQRSLLGMYEIDEFGLDDDSDSGLFYPGKVFHRRQGADPNQPTIRPVPIGQADPQILQWYGAQQSEVENDIGLGSSLSQPRTQGRMTGMEFNQQQASAGVVLEFIFQTLECDFLKPFLRMFYFNMLQYMPQWEWDNWIDQRKKVVQSPGAVQILESLRGMPPEQRIAQFGDRMRFRCRVYSALVDRQSEIEKITFLFGTISKTPASQHVNWRGATKKMLDALNWPYEELLLEVPMQQMPKDPFDGQPLQAEMQQAQQASMQQAQQPQPGQGGPVPSQPPTVGASQVGSSPSMQGAMAGH